MYINKKNYKSNINLLLCYNASAASQWNVGLPAVFQVASSGWLISFYLNDVTGFLLKCTFDLVWLNYVVVMSLLRFCAKALIDALAVYVSNFFYQYLLGNYII